jgi:hypothetical protein
MFNPYEYVNSDSECAEDAARYWHKSDEAVELLNRFRADAAKFAAIDDAEHLISEYSDFLHDIRRDYCANDEDHGFDSSDYKLFPCADTILEQALAKVFEMQQYHCNDCDFTTDDPDVRICPQDKGCVA